MNHRKDKIKNYNASTINKGNRSTGRKMNILLEYYGISNTHELVRFLIAKEYRELFPEVIPAEVKIP